MIGCGAVEDEALLSVQEQPASSSTSCNGTDTNRACSSGNGCSAVSGCQQQQQQQGSFGSWVRRQAATSSAASAEQQQQQPGSLGTCMKCKAAPAVTHIRQNEPYCHSCIETGVISKFRYATKGQGLIATGDSVLLALSGGAASMALLWCTLAMQSANSSRPERGKVPFQLALLHVDRSTAWGVPEVQAQQRVQQLQAAVAAAGFGGQLLVLQLQDVFANTQEQLLQLLQDQQQQQQQRQQQQQHPDAQQLQEQLQAANLAAAGEQQTSQQWRQQWQQQLLELLNAVSDATGREDMAVHLQDLLVLRAAAALGCSRLLRGECASRIAANIIGDAAKGRGFSVPADIQLLDARLLQQGGPAVLRPLREVTHKELAALCAYKSLAWSDREMGQRSSGSNAGRGSSGHGAASLNQLAERFIADMQGSVPASIYTILRTASHLQPFGFNALAAVPGAADMQSSAARQSAKKQQQPPGQLQAENGSQQQWQLCSVCRAPLPAAVFGAEDGGAGTDAAACDRLLLAGLTGPHSRQLCYTCNRQVLYQVEVQQKSSSAAADTSQEARMQRLRQLLPPGLLLDED